MGGILSGPVSSKWIARFGNKEMRVASCDMSGYREYMEDQCNITLSSGTNAAASSGASFFGVYDGHSGMAASQYLHDNLPRKILALKDPTDHEALTKVVLDVDAAFCKQVDERGHGSTCCFVVVTPDDAAADVVWKATVCNVGDSRAIILRGNGDFVSCTEDHKPGQEEEKKRIVAAGGTVSDGRVDGSLAMSRAIGDWCYKKNPGLSVLEQRVIPLPTITTYKIYKGDSLLVYCDGIVENLTNHKVAEFCHEKLAKTRNRRSNRLKNGAASDPAAVMVALLDYALASGSKDNMTAMLVSFENGSDWAHLPPATATEYIAGPYRKFATESSFQRAYTAFAKRCGISDAENKRLCNIVDLTAMVAENQRLAADSE